MKLSEKNKKGFTLIELVVVMAVFLFVVGAAVSIFLSVIQNQKKVLSEAQLLNQISYVEEYMSKAMRMATSDVVGTCLVDNSASSSHPGQYYQGYNYLLTRPDIKSDFYTGIKFINLSDNNSCQEFYLDNFIHGDFSTPLVLKELKATVCTSDQECNTGRTCVNNYCTTNDNDAVALTSSSMKINFIRFGIDGTNGCYGGCPVGDQVSSIAYLQPRITMVLNVTIAGDSQAGSRTIQTTVSQRNLNINNGQR